MLKSFSVPLLVVSLIIGVCSCTSKAAKDQSFSFYYFPERNVYFDIANTVFTYTIDGGKSWSHVEAASKTLPATLGEKVLLNSPVSTPWVHNQDHRMAYNAVASDFTVFKDIPAATLPTLEEDVSKSKKEEPNWGQRGKRKEDRKKEEGRFLKQLKEGFKGMAEDIKKVGKKKELEGTKDN